MARLKVDEVTTAIRSITADAAKVKTLVDEVNLGSQEQARGIEQIGKAIVQMEQVTQATAASAEESASAAEELNAQSETLKDALGRLKSMVGGEAASGNVRETRSAKSNARRGQPAAPRQAVVHEPKYDHPKAVIASHASEQDAFPMEEHFTEF